MAKQIKEVAVAEVPARVSHTVEEVREILKTRGAEFTKTVIQAVKMVSIPFVNANGDAVEELRFSLSLRDKVRGVWTNDGERSIDMSRTIMISPITMNALLVQDPMFARFMATWNEQPKMLCSYLTGCAIELAQEEVKMGDVYTSPFSEKQYEIKQDTVITNVLSLTAQGESLELMRDQLKNISLF